MKKIFIAPLCALLAGCEMGTDDLTPSLDGSVADVARQPHLGPTGATRDALPASLEDAVSGYGQSGVLVNLGVNPCGPGGWDPNTGRCYPPPLVPWNEVAPTSGVCGAAPTCGAHAPGTVLLWDSTLPRYRYLADPSGGYVCLPNDVPYVVSC
jgi:hypothetical protein